MLAALIMRALSILPEVRISRHSNAGQVTDDKGLGMQHGLMRIAEYRPVDSLSAGEQSFVRYISNPDLNVMSSFDGGQLMFSFQCGQKSLLWNGHLGAYPGIMQSIEPKPSTITLERYDSIGDH
jgi:hypothetical protein